MSYLGVDACPGGWFAAIVDEEGLKTEEPYEAFERLWEEHDDCERLLVDIPIGIAKSELRACDIEAKDRLGCRGSSVFYTPSRTVVDEQADMDYEEANEENRAQLDRGLSQQAWNLVPKIAEMDAFLQSNDGLAGERIRESHPELCFYAFNDRDPIAYSKHSERGRDRRQAVLEATGLNGVETAYAEAIEAYYRKDVGKDDIWDAIVLAAAAQHGEFVSLPEDEEPTDSAEPPMEIVYPDFEEETQ